MMVHQDGNSEETESETATRITKPARWHPYGTSMAPAFPLVASRRLPTRRMLDVGAASGAVGAVKLFLLAYSFGTGSTGTGAGAGTGAGICTGIGTGTGTGAVALALPIAGIGTGILNLHKEGT